MKEKFNKQLNQEIPLKILFDDWCNVATLLLTQ